MSLPSGAGQQKVIRLHRRDRAELRKARHVVRIADLDVFHPPAPVARSVDRVRGGVAVEGGPHGGVADGVGHHDEAAPVEFREHRRVAICRIVRRAGRRRGDVRRQHVGGVRLDDAVHEELHDSRAHPIAGIAAAGRFERLEFLQRKRVARACAGRIGGRHPNRQLAAVVERLVEIHFVEVAAGVDHAADAARIGRRQTAADRRQHPIARRHGNDASNQRLGAFFERAGRFAGRRIAHDRSQHHAVLDRIRSVARDPRLRQRFGVGPQRVPVERIQRRRPVCHGGIEQRLRRQSARRKRVVLPISAKDPRFVGMGARERCDYVRRLGPAFAHRLRPLACAPNCRSRNGRACR